MCRPYLDYQRAKCEDLEVIQDWLELVRNTIAKYCNCDEDILKNYEIGFVMAVILIGSIFVIVSI